MARRDYYSEARQIASNMREDGYTDWADRIERSIAAGATSTEILMAIRFDMIELLASDIAMRDQSNIIDLIQALDELLA